MAGDLQADEGDSPLGSAEADMKELLGLYDAPAFSRRGQELEQALHRFHERCRQERDERLDMVRMRLRQWAATTTGLSSALEIFRSSIEPLWPLVGAETPLFTATGVVHPRRFKAASRDLVASVERFNRRWLDYVDRLTVEHLNRMIEQYNRYYLLEKECCLGSSRLAARFFVPRERISREWMLKQYPLLPVPEWKTGSV